MKKDLRAEARARLAALTSTERAVAAAQIARHLWTLPPIATAKRLLLYAALPSEVPTDDVAREAGRRGIELVYPRSLPASRELALHRVASSDELQAGTYGVLEPSVDCAPVDPRTLDAAIIPGLGWDRAGHRLGRGAGYYDRLLGSGGWTAFACGIFFSVQEFAALPTDPWDARLDAVVTETEILGFGS